MPFGSDSSVESRVGEGGEELMLIAREVGFVGEHVDNRRIEPAFKQRQQLRPHAISRHAHVIVGRIVNESDPMLREVLPQVRPATLEQRPNEVSVSGMHGPESPGAGPSQKAEQEGFGLIVARMPEGDEVSAELNPRALQKRVPSGSRGVLDRPALQTGELADIRPIDHERPSQRLSQHDAKRFVAIGFNPQLVIEVSQTNEATLARSIQTLEQVR
jgi:hypothetical protein